MSNWMLSHIVGFFWWHEENHIVGGEVQLSLAQYWACALYAFAMWFDMVILCNKYAFEDRDIFWNYLNGIVAAKDYSDYYEDLNDE